MGHVFGESHEMYAAPQATVLSVAPVCSRPMCAVSAFQCVSRCWFLTAACVTSPFALSATSPPMQICSAAPNPSTTTFRTGMSNIFIEQNFTVRTAVAVLVAVWRVRCRLGPSSHSSHARRSCGHITCLFRVPPFHALLPVTGMFDSTPGPGSNQDDAPPLSCVNLIATARSWFQQRKGTGWRATDVVLCEYYPSGLGRFPLTGRW